MNHKIVDTHCHLDFSDFQNDLNRVIENAKNNNVEYFLSISVNLDKEMPDVVFTGEQYPLFAKYKSILEDSFGHLFRNSLDHGLETTDVRLEMGKSKNGRIEINTKLKDERVLLSRRRAKGRKKLTV